MTQRIFGTLFRSIKAGFSGEKLRYNEDNDGKNIDSD